MRKSILILLMAGAATVLYAQTGSNSKEWIIKESRRLYTDGEYNTALNILDKIDTKSLSPTEKQEIELLRATATYATNHLEGRALLLQYLADHPETSRKDVITALIGESYYYSHNFDLASKWFKKADLSRLEIKDRERAELHYALTLQECGEEQMARNLLTNLAFTGKEYAEDAQFHLATIQYHNNELQQAYEGFKKVEMSDKYHLEVPYYLAGIYVKQEKFAQAQGVAEAFIADHKFPEDRWDENTARSNPDDMSVKDIKSKFQLLSTQTNLHKQRHCATCITSKKRGYPYGIKYYYSGGEDWDAKYPEHGADAEKGCVGCGWYDLLKWKEALNKELNKK